MYKNKLIFLIVPIFILTSCSAWQDVKGGLTGAKRKSSDEFLIEKKDPLVLPPNYDKLPSPDTTKASNKETSIFEKTLETEDATSNNSTEKSILEKIKKR